MLCCGSRKLSPQPKGRRRLRITCWAILSGPQARGAPWSLRQVLSGLRPSLQSGRPAQGHTQSLGLSWDKSSALLHHSQAKACPHPHAQCGLASGNHHCRQMWPVKSSIRDRAAGNSPSSAVCPGLSRALWGVTGVQSKAAMDQTSPAHSCTVPFSCH